MGKFVDRTGHRYGKLTVIEIADRRTPPKWRCQCDCGKERVADGYQLQCGRVTICGCGRIKDLTGKRFGMLTVVEMTGERVRAAVQWLCRCDCGNETVSESKSLQSGDKMSAVAAASLHFRI